MMARRVVVASKNPDKVGELEEVLGSLEGGSALTFASGSAGSSATGREGAGSRRSLSPPAAPPLLSGGGGGLATGGGGKKLSWARTCPSCRNSRPRPRQS